jgi:signal transduction histidine kinase/CheY-like chemotaxis protein
MVKVLIVDDKQSNLFALENVLKRLDVEIVKASTGDEALRATLNDDFALAIVDVQMPVMDGYELAKLLRSDERTRSIPIIFLSAVYSEDTYVFKGYEAGAVDFITKPFVPEVLLSKVRVFLELNERKAELVSHKDRLEVLVAQLVEQVEARSRVEREILRKNTLLEGMNRVLREAITCETEEELAKTCLTVAEDLTGSSFGFIGEIDEKGLFNGIALSDPGWSECRMPKSDAVRLVKNMKIRGIWGEVLKEGKPLIVNDPGSHPKSIGCPQGHPAIKTFFGVPLKKGDITTGMIALANKEAGYEQADIQALEPLCAAFVEALSRKRAEDQIRRARNELELRVRERTAELSTAVAGLESMNEELQEFAFIASHDLQEPLRKIQTFGNMLIDKHKASLNPEGQDFLGRITKAANRMSELLRSLLNYSRTGTSQLNFKAVSLTEVARDASTDLEVLIEKAKGRVEITELPVVYADAALLRQLFQNMIENAIKYRKESEPPIVKIYGDIADSVCRVFIEDNGIGFDQCYCQKIFKPFERLHGRNDPYQGTGMGLSICRKIVDRHGGQITVRSIPGEGTTFIVTLPIERKTRA